MSCLSKTNISCHTSCLNTLHLCLTRNKLIFILVHLRFVHYHYDLGTGAAKLQSKNAISLNTAHTVVVTRYQGFGTLKVDSQAMISGQSTPKAVGLDVKSDFYLGGVPQLSTVNPAAVADSSSLKDFVGCVTSVTVGHILCLKYKYR